MDTEAPNSSGDVNLPPPPPVPKSHGSLAVKIVVAVLVVLVLACGGVVFGLWELLSRTPVAQIQSSCAGNLAILNAGIQMYGGENRGMFPALGIRDGRVSFSLSPLKGEYLPDGSVLVCPEAPVGEDGDSRPFDGYAFLSHVLTSEAEGSRFIEECKARAASGGSLNEDFNPPPGSTEAPLRRFRRGVERFMVSDPLDHRALDALTGKIPLVVEYPGHHERPGGNVLYLDGHVAFVPYPGPFPMTEGFIKGIKALQATPRP